MSGLVFIKALTADHCGVVAAVAQFGEVELIPALGTGGLEIGPDAAVGRHAAGHRHLAIALCLGCGHVEEITPESHDKIIAYTSNLPHAAAAALINSDRFGGQSCWFIGGGFRDVTRIADINAGLWSDLFLENRENVLSELENFRTQIETLQKLINENNREGLQEFLQKAACHRKEIVL